MDRTPNDEPRDNPTGGSTPQLGSDLNTHNIPGSQTRAATEESLGSSTESLSIDSLNQISNSTERATSMQLMSSTEVATGIQPNDENHSSSLRSEGSSRLPSSSSESRRSTGVSAITTTTTTFVDPTMYTILVEMHGRKEALMLPPDHQQFIVDAGTLPHLVALLKRRRDDQNVRTVNGAIRKAADAITNLAHENSSIKTCVRLVSLHAFQLQLKIVVSMAVMFHFMKPLGLMPVFFLNHQYCLFFLLQNLRQTLDDLTCNGFSVVNPLISDAASIVCESMSTPSKDPLLQVETTCGSLLYELQVFF
ncbi:Armadillo [Cynara cardunculus var. scolymus]|uniref:Armadillo n=1 Tax=Cynara cardunculus var. scolymus TaxID=59895 RepID=A0A103XI61_CYNCS|nr:Armadillo [Cynara cardunculus var. scolymus]